MTQYIAGTYVKGDDERVAKDAKAAVALAFDGYRLKQEEPAEVEVKDEAPAAPVATPRPPLFASKETPKP